MSNEKEKNDEDMEDFYEPMNEEYPEDDSKRYTKRLSALCDI